MLSKEEKREMLEDAKDKHRREDFRTKKVNNLTAISFDLYLSFLDSVQRIFSPFKASRHRTITKFNKL